MKEPRTAPTATPAIRPANEIGGSRVSGVAIASNRRAVASAEGTAPNSRLVGSERPRASRSKGRIVMQAETVTIRCRMLIFNTIEGSRRSLTGR